MELATPTRRRLGHGALAFAIVVLHTPPLVAQEPGVRRSFSYLGDQLTIVVRSESAGRLRLLHGRIGQIDVYAAAAGGAAVPSLGGRFGDELTLASLGGDGTDWIVATPPDARVRVRLPGSREAATFAAPSDAASFSWEARQSGGAVAMAGPAVAPYGLPVLPSSEPSAASVVYVLGSTAAVPRFLDVTDATRLRSVTVRLGSSRFRVLADRPLRLESQPDRGTRVEIEPGTARLTIEVPTDARVFAMRLDATTALDIVDGTVRSLCPSAVRQRMSDRRRWITFTDPRACVGH